METIYDWLLHNVGNEGNYLTILNVQRQTNQANVPSIDVMARTREFEVVNLIISPEEAGSASDKVSTNTGGYSTLASYLFANEQAIINYLSTGETGNAVMHAPGIRVVVLKTTEGIG